MSNFEYDYSEDGYYNEFIFTSGIINVALADHAEGVSLSFELSEEQTRELYVYMREYYENR